MILQSLVKYYEDQIKLGILPRPGWSTTKVSYVVQINDEGEVTDIISIKREVERGKKRVLMPQNMIMPSQVGRTSKPVSYFLCDNSGYIFGISNKGNPKRDIECFEKCKELHIKVLSGIDTVETRALINFFEKWTPESAGDNKVIRENWECISDGDNLIFRYKDRYLHEIEEIVGAWDKYYSNEDNESKDKAEGICLITGEHGNIEATHPLIKGVKDAQTSGAAIISFNNPSFCSYGKEQNYNAPVSKYAAFAYTTALNHLISDRENVNYVGDTAVLCWADGGEKVYQSFASICLFGNDENYTDQDIRDKVKRIVQGNSISFNNALIDPDRRFYVLGLAPNAARLSVRFFWQNSFGDLIRNIELHNERLEIVRPDYDKYQEIPVWKLLQETVNPNSKNKAASPVMSGQLLQAILTDGRYPATLLNYIHIRIRADRKINRYRAAIIKAYYLKNGNNYVPEEVLTVALNKETTNVPYNLGRLFSVLESIQQKANPGITTTIVDKYFNSASATPATVFPVLLNLSQKHLKKISGGLQVVLSKDMREILDIIGESFPRRMNLAQQGSFQLGYYHQTQFRYQGKEKEGE